MHNVRLGLIWAAVILIFAIIANSIGMDKQTSLIFVAGLGVLAVLHIGRSENRKKSCNR